MNKLKNLAEQVEEILKDELKKRRIRYDVAEAEIYNIKNVGVQGDNRSYEYPAQITIRYKSGRFNWNNEFLTRLSTRITNQVVGVNRVVYLIKKIGDE